ncbi:MAG: TlpA family protein disulfide reductase [Balneolaceae bacterium]|nr:TlpA family protein disulfide reductase [Balneolaceae bacterium]
MNEVKSSQSPFRSIAEWMIILAIPLVLYLTGWHTEVSGRLQQAILWTGLIQPEIKADKGKGIQINYDVPLISLDGDSTNLGAYKGKVIFLNFWATWCPPCIAEMPNIQSLYERFKSNKNITFLMISLDEDPDKARKFIERKGFTFPVYLLNGRRPAIFQSSTIPTTYVINKSGMLVVEKQGMANYNTSSFRTFLKNVAQD